MRTLRTALICVAGLVGMSQFALAETSEHKPTAATSSAVVPQVPMVAPAPSEAGLDLRKPPADKEPHITETWWFWAAAGGVVLTTVAIVLVAGRSQEEPKTTLGDMRAFR
jgi:hypothetical protein